MRKSRVSARIRLMFGFGGNARRGWLSWIVGQRGAKNHALARKKIIDLCSAGSGSRSLNAL